MNKFADRIERLREYMKQEGIAVYYIPMDDCHSSEYVADHFRCIEFMSGFTGSAAQLIVSAGGAWLYTDGRYFVQAEKQLAGSGIELMKMATDGVPEPEEFIAQLMCEAGDEAVFGFDGNVVTAQSAMRFISCIAQRAGLREDEVSLKADQDLAGRVWNERPAQIFSEVRLFDEKYAGESAASKLSRIRAELSKEVRGEDYLYLVSSLDDIAWIFNIRANDIADNPVAYAFAAITPERAVLYTGGGSTGGAVRAALKAQGAEVGAYAMDCLLAEDPGCPVLMDTVRTSYAIYDHYRKMGCRVHPLRNPSVLMKAIKNPVELGHACDALLRDSVVLIKFMYWLKKKAEEAGTGNYLLDDDGQVLNEVTADVYLTGLRAEDPLFFEPSFATIAAYKENGAMMHYQAKPDNYKELKAEGMLLVDSGGQYEDGTTDITRTFILGPVSGEEKKAFTLTAVSMLRLLDTKFICGCSGEMLDIRAREPMWREGWDYKCGTGHGVGHVLNVHEGPHNIRWRIGPNGPSARMEEGMIVTDEPGVYRAGKYGIRTENEMFVKFFKETEDGRFLCFETMTYIPIDLDGIDVQYMTAEDRKLLNDYHRAVYERTAPFLSEEVAAWLRKYTAEV